MAFQAPGISAACSNCFKHWPYYKLFRSDREQHVKYDDEGKTYHMRLCADCEHHFGIIETDDWSLRPENERNDDPEYATMARVIRDIRKQSRGESWYQTGVAMKRAKAELQEERAMERTLQVNRAVCVEVFENGTNNNQGGTPMDVDAQSSVSSVSPLSKQERKRWVMQRSKSIAEGLINALMKCSATWDAFETAGDRSSITAEALERLEHYEAALEHATVPAAIEQIQEEIARATAEVADQATYRTAETTV